MAFEQRFTQECKSMASAAADAEEASPCFDCNICLDFAREPVVTLCGHLYCWPCIYKWLQLQSDSGDSNEQPQCPVCKARISQSALVPLFGRGGRNLSDAEQPEGKAAPIKTNIPPRPSAGGSQFPTHPVQTLLRHQHHQHHQDSQSAQYASHQREHLSSSPSFNLGSSVAMGVFHPVVGMFGEMVYAGSFGNSEGLYAYPNSYHLVGSSSPRLRRHQQQADKSLGRISIFLLCCLLLCLLLF